MDRPRIIIFDTSLRDGEQSPVQHERRGEVTPGQQLDRLAWT